MPYTNEQLMRSFAGAHGKFAPISGVIGHDYEIVPAKDAIFDWDDKRVMTYESYQKLRNEIGR